jgi:hypothetical protein
MRTRHQKTRGRWRILLLLLCKCKRLGVHRPRSCKGRFSIAPREARQTTAYAGQCGSVGYVVYATHLDEQQV